MEAPALNRADGEALLLSIMPYAKAAARRTRFKYDIDEDDTFQQIMLDCWQKIATGFVADEPIAWLRTEIRHSVGDVLYSHFGKKANSMVGPMPTMTNADGEREEIEFAAPHRDVDFLLMRKVAKGLHAKGPAVVRTFHDVHLLGFSRQEVAQRRGVHDSRIGQILATAVSTICEITGAELEQTGVRKRRDTDTYRLRNDDGREIIGDRKKLTAESGVPAGALSRIITGSLKHYKSWRLVR